MAEVRSMVRRSAYSQCQEGPLQQQLGSMSLDHTPAPTTLLRPADTTAASQDPTSNSSANGTSVSPSQDGGGVSLAEPSSTSNLDSIDELVLTALNSSAAKDRQLIRQLDKEIRQFLADDSRSVLHLPPKNSFHRLICHKVAEYFNLDHVVDAMGKSVVYSKNQSSHPSDRLRKFLEAVDTEAESRAAQQESFKIMRRSRNEGKGHSSQGGRASSDDGVDRSGRPRTLSEREEMYNKARARIFSSSSSEAPSRESPTNSAVASVSAAPPQQPNPDLATTPAFDSVLLPRSAEPWVDSLVSSDPPTEAEPLEPVVALPLAPRPKEDPLNRPFPEAGYGGNLGQMDWGWTRQGAPHMGQPHDPSRVWSDPQDHGRPSQSHGPPPAQTQQQPMMYNNPAMPYYPNPYSQPPRPPHGAEDPVSPWGYGEDQGYFGAPFMPPRPQHAGRGRSRGRRGGGRGGGGRGGGGRGGGGRGGGGRGGRGRGGHMPAGMDMHYMGPPDRPPQQPYPQGYNYMPGYHMPDYSRRGRGRNPERRLYDPNKK